MHEARTRVSLYLLEVTGLVGRLQGMSADGHSSASTRLRELISDLKSSGDLAGERSVARPGGLKAAPRSPDCATVPPLWMHLPVVPSMTGYSCVPSSLIALFGLPVPAAAQQVPETRLTKPDARFPRELSSVTGLLELPDGRVLVSDGIDETLLRIDLRTMKADTISRSGAGPGEYKGPDLLYGLPAGGVLLVDLGNARLSFFDAALKYKESSPIARGEPATGLTMVVPDGVDSQGRIYFRSMMRNRNGSRRRLRRGARGGTGPPRRSTPWAR